MFFDLILLTKQNNGRFCLAWIAATRGITHVDKRKIREIDITLLCRELMQFVITNTKNPTQRFSLRLSSLLMHGTVRIFKQKAIFLQDDLATVLSTIQLPSSISELKPTKFLRTFDTPPTPLAREKKRKQKPAQESESSEFQAETFIRTIQEGITLAELIPDEGVNLQARLAETTIREEMGREKIGVSDDLLGELGVLTSEMEEQMFLISPQVPLAEKTQLQITTEKAIESVHKTKKSQVESPESEEQAAIVIQVEAQIHVSADIADVEPVVSTIHREKTPEEEQQPAIEIETGPQTLTTLDENQAIMITEVPEAPPVTEPPKEKEKSPIELQKAPKSTKRKTRSTHLEEPTIAEVSSVQKPKTMPKSIPIGLRVIFGKAKSYVAINKHYEIYEAEELSPFSDDEKVSLNIKLLVLNMWEVDYVQRSARNDVTEARSGSNIVGRSSGMMTASGTTVESIQSEGISHRSSRGIIASTPITTEGIPIVHLEIPHFETPSTPKRRKEQITIEEEVALAGEIQGPKKSRLQTVQTAPQPLSVQSEVEIEEVPVEQFVQPEKILPTRKKVRQLRFDAPSDEIENRQRNIIDCIREWNFEKDELTIEKLAEKPLSKLTISRAFSDLLELCKAGYVVLRSEENSCELQYIEKGRKLL